MMISKTLVLRLLGGLLLAGMGVAAPLLADERADYRVTVFSESPLVAARAAAALRARGYSRVATQSNPTPTLNVKWGGAPAWMISEIGTAVAQTVGEPLNRFMGMPIFAATDPDIFVNLPVDALRHDPIEERSAVASGPGRTRSSTIRPTFNAKAKPAATPRVATRHTPPRRVEARPPAKAYRERPAVKAGAAAGTSGPFEHFEEGGAPK